MGAVHGLIPAVTFPAYRPSRVAAEHFLPGERNSALASCFALPRPSLDSSAVGAAEAGRYPSWWADSPRVQACYPPPGRARLWRPASRYLVRPWTRLALSVPVAPRHCRCRIRRAVAWPRKHSPPGGCLGSGVLLRPTSSVPGLVGSGVLLRPTSSVPGLVGSGVLLRPTSSFPGLACGVGADSAGLGVPGAEPSAVLPSALASCFALPCPSPEPCRAVLCCCWLPSSVVAGRLSPEPPRPRPLPPRRPRFEPERLPPRLPAGRVVDWASWLRSLLFSCAGASCAGASCAGALWRVPEEPPRLEPSSRPALRLRPLCWDPEPRLPARRRSLS